MVERRGAAPREPLVTMEEARAQGRRELFERLEALLLETRGNVAEMARRLGKDRSTVRYHLRRFGMLGEGRTGEGRTGAGLTGEGRTGATTSGAGGEPGGREGGG